MNDDFTDADTDHVVGRLRALGADPIEPHLAGHHLTAMATAPVRTKRFGPVAVAAATVVGFLVGSTGLAAAGALPGQGQDVAAVVLAQVGVDVPRTHGQCISELAGSISDDDPAKGERVSAAARGESEECPKPGRRGHARFGARPHEGDPCRGAPVWAGRGRPTPEEKAAHHAARQACGDADGQDLGRGPGGGRPDEPGAPPSDQGSEAVDPAAPGDAGGE
jgi:hypothetical protein